jgi:hypothetical protein
MRQLASAHPGFRYSPDDMFACPFIAPYSHARRMLESTSHPFQLTPP